MLRITARKGGKSAAAYYLRDDAGNRAEGIAFGELAAKMGISGVVDHAQFTALCDNIDFRTGKRWTARADDPDKRVALYDLTFLEPKSFTLLRHLTGDERLEEARREALFETAAFIEQDATVQTRLGPLRGVAKTGNIAGVAWFHESGRPSKADGMSDPMGHCHFTILNASDHNGRVRSLNFRFRDNEYYAAIHSSILTKKTADLGYGVVQKGKKYWEVEGVGAGLIKKFSRRQEESEAWLEKASHKAQSKVAEKRARGEALTKAEEHVELHGLTGKAKSQAGAASRSKKRHDMTLAELVEYWRGRLTEKEAATLEGLKKEALERSLSQNHAAVEAEIWDKAVKAEELPGNPVELPRQPEELVAKPVKPAKVPNPVRKPDAPARKAANPPKAEKPKPETIAARAAVKDAWVEGVAKRKPEMPYRKLASAAMQKVLGKADAKDVHQAIDTCGLPRTEKNGSVYLGRKPVDLAKRVARWSGEKMRRLKYEMIRAAHQPNAQAVHRQEEARRAGVHR